MKQELAAAPASGRKTFKGFRCTQATLDIPRIFGFFGNQANLDLLVNSGYGLQLLYYL